MSLTNALLIVGALCIFRASSSVLERPEKSNDTNHVDMALSSDNITTLPVNPSLDLSWPLSSPSAQTANFSNSSLSTFSGVTPDPSGVPSLNTAVTKCDGSVYGFDLNAASCQEAWNLLPKSTNRRTFGKRSEGHFNVPLPFRILSSDGLCAIDITHRVGLFYDISTADELAKAAATILAGCVLATHQGGVAGYLGDFKGLAVRIVPNKNNVQCSPPSSGPPLGSCRPVLDTMPASYNQQVFGRRRAGGVEVVLPQFFSDAWSNRCLIAANTVGTPNTVAWYVLYLAAVAVDAICCRQGRGGIATDLGDRGQGSIFVTIRDQRPGADAAAAS